MSLHIFPYEIPGVQPTRDHYVAIAKEPMGCIILPLYMRMYTCMTIPAHVRRNLRQLFPLVEMAQAKQGRSKQNKQTVRKRAESKSECKVQKIRTLGLQRDEEVLQMLEHISWQVEPIMKKRCWRVSELKELPPENTSRLGDNMNRGMRVRLKCRQTSEPDCLLSYESVLQTMLHELAHCRIGPHNDDFWQLLDEVTQECFSLRWHRTGGTCEGFDKPSNGTAGFVAGWGVPSEVPDDPRHAAKRAAEKRFNNRIQEHGVVGSCSDKHSQPTDPREAARQAAERRQREQEFAKANGLLHDVEVIELDAESDDSGENAGICMQGHATTNEDEHAGVRLMRNDGVRETSAATGTSTSAEKAAGHQHGCDKDNDVIVLDAEEDRRTIVQQEHKQDEEMRKRKREQVDSAETEAPGTFDVEEIDLTGDAADASARPTAPAGGGATYRDSTTAKGAGADEHDDGIWRISSESTCQLAYTLRKVECPCCGRGVPRDGAKEHLRKCQRKRRRRQGLAQVEEESAVVGGEGKA